MWLSIELLAHARFYIRIRTTRGSLPHVVIIISAYCITIFLSSACAYKPGFTVCVGWVGGWCYGWNKVCFIDYWAEPLSSHDKMTDRR